MIIAVVQFPLPEGMSPEDATALFEASRPRYEGMTGLIRKDYLLDADGRTGGGVYLWESREAAEAVYEGGAWRDGIRTRFGGDPDIRYFDTPVSIDNSA